jgi:hypothetical protein
MDNNPERETMTEPSEAVLGVNDAGQTVTVDLSAEIEPDRPSVQEAVNAVMRDVQVIAKGQEFNERGVRYSFRGIDDVVNAVGPKLREHRVVITPVRSKVVSTERYETKHGTVMQNVIVRVAYNVVGPRGDWLAAEAMGQSADTGDKAVAKAQSVAYRVMLLGLLCIPTGEVDPDSENHERAASTPPASNGRAVPDDWSAVNNQIGEWMVALGWNQNQVFDAYAKWNGGQVLEQADTAARRSFVQQLAAHHLQAKAPKTNLGPKLTNLDPMAGQPAPTLPKTNVAPDAHVAGGPYPDVQSIWELNTQILALADSLGWDKDKLAVDYSAWNGNRKLAEADAAGLQEFVKQLRHELDHRKALVPEPDALTQDMRDRVAEADAKKTSDDPPF